MLIYETYIQSPQWHIKAKRAKELAGQCAVCTRTTSLEVHHRTYDRLGYEHPNDLVVLCALHHRRIHGTYDECIEHQQLQLPMIPDGVQLN